MFPFFASPFRFQESSPFRVLTSIVVVFLILGVGGVGGQAGWAQSSTQTLSLDAGWNLVSLRVQPDDASLDAILGSNVSAFHMVKNTEGKAYVPSKGIEQLNTWAVDEGYRVYVESPVNLSVSGTAVSTGSTPVVLEKGGNLVPYFASIPLASESAFQSIESSLVRVESEGGEIYDPDASSPELDSLRPSQGYKVYVDRRDTLTYPTVVPTLADAKSLENVEIGESVRVQGYHDPGDGGGGLFQVNDSACETDGGTCFVFNEDRSAKVTDQTDALPFDYPLSNDNIIWGTTKVRYGPDPEDVIGIKHLHGQSPAESGPVTPEINLKDGVIDFLSSTIGFNDEYGYGDNQNFQITYQHATSSRRLERIGVGNAVDLAWWGAPKLDPNNPQTADPYLKWAINAAAEIYQNSSYEWTYVDISDRYYWLHSMILRNGTLLRGTGPVISQEWNTRGELRLMPNMALWYRLKNFDMSAPENRNIVHGGRGNMVKHVFFNESYSGGAEKIGFENLEIDGNLRNNQNIFDNESDYDGNVRSHLQNSGSYSGFYTTGASGQSYPDGMIVKINDTDINDMAAMAIGVGGGKAQVNTQNVRTETDGRSHIIYSPTGENVDDLVVEGAGWGSLAVLGDNRTPGVFEGSNLTVRNLRDGRFGYNNIISDRDGPTLLDGFDIDMRGLEDVSGPDDSGSTIDIIAQRGHGSTWKNGTIEGPDQKISSSAFLFSQRGRQIEDAQTTVENITVTVNSSHTIGLHKPSDRFLRSLFKEITIEVADGVTVDDTEASNIGWGLRDLDPNRPRADRSIYKNVHVLSPWWKLGAFLVADKRVETDTAHPLDVFWDKGELNYVGRPTDDGGRNWTSLHGRPVDGDRFRIHLHDVTLNSPDDPKYPFRTTNWHEHMRPESQIRLRNCQDNSGGTSDATGTYTSGADDEGNDYVLIETSLMSRAFERSATVTSGNRTVQSVEVANSDGSLRADNNELQKDPYLRVNLDSAIQAGNTIDVDWTARVTPMERYQTTGLFVTRPVSNKSYTSGSGLWTLDLRGVAASQESREKIVYTASSEDSAVVSANVQGDDYTLDLTEQGTGTTTVTVTGSIDGVGTTTDTFEVTIE